MGVCIFHNCDFSGLGKFGVEHCFRNLLFTHHLCYLQLGVDIGSSTVARGVVSLVLGYLNKLVIEMAFLVQVNQFPIVKLVIITLLSWCNSNPILVFPLLC